MQVIKGGPAATGRWFHRYLTRPRAQRVLYAFPFAGGSASAYRPWTRLLPEDIELRAVQLPGRHDRADDRRPADFSELVADLATAISQDAGGRRFGFFGHSMGALLAYEVALELRRRGAEPPTLLAVSGCSAPHRAPVFPPFHSMPDPELLAAVSRLGGIPDEVAAHPELLAIVLPVLREDFRLLHSYQRGLIPGRRLLTCPISAFGGEEDEMVSVESLHAWADTTDGAVVVRTLEGGHFFLARHGQRIVADIVNALRESSMENS